MNVLKNKKGFTLIELLAVIVVLAVIILIAAGNIGGMTTTARKNVLATEGNVLVDGAKSVYQLAILEGDITTGPACFSLAYLYNQGYFTKGPTSDPKYTGSVLVEPDANGKIYTYHFWISNSSYTIANAESGASGKIATNGTTASENCGGKTGVTLFKADGTKAQQ